MLSWTVHKEEKKIRLLILGESFWASFLASCPFFSRDRSEILASFLQCLGLQRSFSLPKNSLGPRALVWKYLYYSSFCAF